MYSKGLLARDEDVPTAPSTHSTRSASIGRGKLRVRITKDLFDKSLWLALSVENPQTTFTGVTPSGAGTQSVSAATGGGLLDPDTGSVTYSNDAARRTSWRRRHGSQAGVTTRFTG